MNVTQPLTTFKGVDDVISFQSEAGAPIGYVNKCWFGGTSYSCRRVKVGVGNEIVTGRENATSPGPSFIMVLIAAPSCWSLKCSSTGCTWERRIFDIKLLAWKMARGFKLFCKRSS